MKPDNMPHDWEYCEKTETVTCGGCLFRFGAEHQNEDGTWTCPNCDSGNSEECAPNVQTADKA